ncbi:YbaB/EbfC family nucleoid-associated protein [Amycolatopsis sp. NPDC049868]|uniref:YbaB/EbfC family nucleoid-associated protein n=1 Tax=Amycolatopsis sp. NPDC049868 TaxID=3363934 RepID=UPI00379CA5D4
MSAEFEQLVAQFDKFQSQLQNVDDRLANVGGMQDELSRIEATASSSDRSVTVVAGPGGAIMDVKFTEDALRQRPDALSAALMSTIQQAVAESARKQATIVEEHMGDDLNLVDQVLETQAELFGTTVEEMRARMDEESPSRPSAEPSDDYSERSVLKSADEPQRPQPPQPPAPGGSDGDRFLKNLFDDDH